MSLQVVFSKNKTTTLWPTLERFHFRSFCVTSVKDGATALLISLSPMNESSVISLTLRTGARLAFEGRNFVVVALVTPKFPK